MYIFIYDKNCFCYDARGIYKASDLNVFFLVNILSI